MRRTAASYQHIDPALVGNVSRVVVSELSGRGNVRAKAEEYGVELPAGAEAQVLEEIKDEEARGFSYEAAEASVALKLRRAAASIVDASWQALADGLEFYLLKGETSDESDDRTASG
jgi:2-isopropylmalate synthase